MTSTDQHRPASDTGAARLGRRLWRGARRLTPTPAERPPWLRLVSIAVGVLWVVGAGVVLGFFSVPSQLHGWLPTIAALLPGMLLLTLGGGLARTRGAQVVAALVLASLLGGWAWYNALPDFDRLRVTADEVGAPEGWRLHDEQVHGNTWGLWADYPQLTRTYGTSDSPAEAEAAIVALLEEDGWDPATDTPTGPGGSYVRWEHWNREVEVRIAAPGAESRAYETGPVPADLTKVTLYFS